VSAVTDEIHALVMPYLDDAERRALERAGYGGTVGVGKRPVVLVVDVTWAFCGDDPTADVLQAVEKYPHASGRFAWEAMPAVRRLVDGARERQVPVIFTRGPSTSSPAWSRWDDKNSRQRSAPPGAGEIVPDSGYRPDDVVLHKEAPSAFFGTPLLRWLTGLGADSVIVCGGTTSGCVRGTVVDAFSHNLKVAVAADATFDRVQASHRIGLFDMNLKYADVLPVARILELLPAPPYQSDLPDGRDDARPRVPGRTEPLGGGRPVDPGTGAHAALSAGGR
jgi:maleamate amidohydrolase